MGMSATAAISQSLFTRCSPNSPGGGAGDAGADIGVGARRGLAGTEDHRSVGMNFQRSLCH